MEIIISIIAGIFSTIFVEPAFISCVYDEFKTKGDNDRHGDLGALFETKFFWIMQAIIFIMTTIITYFLPHVLLECMSFKSDISMILFWALIVYVVSFGMHLMNSLLCGYKTILEYLYPHLKWIKTEVYGLIAIGSMFLYCVL